MPDQASGLIRRARHCSAWQYAVVMTLATSGLAAFVIYFFSGIGRGARTYVWLNEYSYLRFVFFFIGGSVVFVLYLLDFFMGASDDEPRKEPFKGANWLLVLAVLFLLCAIVFSVTFFPYFPLAAALFTTPVVVGVIRLLMKPPLEAWMTVPESLNRQRDSEVEQRAVQHDMAMIRIVEVFRREQERAGFFQGAPLAITTTRS